MPDVDLNMMGNPTVKYNLIIESRDGRVFSPPVKDEVKITWERVGVPGKLEFTTIKSTDGYDMSFWEGDRVTFYIDDKPISAMDRALLAVNYITDYADNQFAYNRQSPLYTLTKTRLEDGHTIERVKSELIRSMTSSIKPEQLALLNTPLESLKITAEKLGLNVSDLCVQIDIKENPYTGNSIALHNDSLPYRLHGKGSKRLMSIAIQSELTKQGGIVMVDELEQGLEPDRIITLVRILKCTTNGQVFITTHSLNVILEAEWNNLFVVNKGAKTLSIVDESLNACRRSNPQAFFAKKIIP